VKFRFEKFGGVVASEDPPFLAFVDQQFMRELGAGESQLWQEPESRGPLTAPVEVHFAITNRCQSQCPHCYMDAGPADDQELSTEAFKYALDRLAEFGVFHIALGGGDALLRPDLFEIAEYARTIGLVPNLTVSGHGMTEEIAVRMKVFGQVNLSLDGIGPEGAILRGTNPVETVRQAAGLLLGAGVPTGLNCVVGRGNFHGLEKLFEWAHSHGLNEVECLRLKPAGRAGSTYEKQKMTPEQNRAFFPHLVDLAERFPIAAKLDCSFVPMLCWHDPPEELLEGLGVFGCEAGNVLVGARSDGSVSGCSFLPSDGLHIEDLPSKWADPTLFGVTRNWVQRAPEPCASCRYLEFCRGGCRAVALYETGSAEGPDPDCPRVTAFYSGRE
jgi:radical SAM protein with 4Fe4S-binding SPASM domain